MLSSFYTHLYFLAPALDIFRNAQDCVSFVDLYLELGLGENHFLTNKTCDWSSQLFQVCTLHLKI